MDSFNSLASTVRGVYRALRYAGVVFIALAVWFLGREVWDLYHVCAAVHPVLGIGFLVAFGVAFYALIVRPAQRYLAVPAAAVPPDLPAVDDAESPLELHHLKRRARAVEKYLQNLRGNPNMAESRDEVERVLAECRALHDGFGSDVTAGRERLVSFENDRVEPLLEPLDREARAIIRRESMAVAIATAMSPSGAADAFFVLWRNANLVASLAQLYYGRPGFRGTFLVIKDVSFGVFVASQMQGLAESGVQAASGFLGKAASPIAGPLADGLVNGLVTMRIGYLASRRCRSFQAFTRKSLARVLQVAFREAAAQSAGLASDLVTKVGVPVFKMPIEMGKKAVDWASGVMRGWFGGSEPGSQPAV